MYFSVNTSYKNCMNETEKRRRQLLRQARELYQDTGEFIPAVHPRYRTAYQSIYGKENEETLQSTLGIRIVICIMIFTMFVLTDYKGTTICNLSSQEIAEQIQLPSNIVNMAKELRIP